MQVFIVIEKGKKGEENYASYSPDVPGCGTTGGTVEEVLHNIKEAIELYYEGEELHPSFRSKGQIVKDVDFENGNILASVNINFDQKKVA